MVYNPTAVSGIQLVNSDVYLSPTQINGGRPAFVLNEGIERRMDVGELVVGSTRSLAEIASIMRNEGIMLVKPRTEFKRYQKNLRQEYIDCRDYVFDTLGLPQLTHRDGGFKADNLLMENFPQIFIVPVPEKGDIVAYFDPVEMRTLHWGLVSEVEGIRVKSKWGGSNVYEHPLETIPLDFGSGVAFFKKI